MSDALGAKSRLPSGAVRVIALAWVGLTAVTAPLAAQGDVPKTSGFGGFVLFGAGYFDARSNLIATGPPLVANISDARIESIFASPTSGTSLALPLSGEVNYTFSGTRTQLFVGNQLEDILNLDVLFGLGVRQELPDKSILAASAIITPLKLEVWSDPYIEGEDRHATDVNYPGFRIRWGRILGTGLELTFTDRFRSLDEESGTWLVDQGRLDPAETSLLDRNGNALELRARYRLRSGRHRFEPTVLYTRDNLHGAAMANRGGSLGLTYLYISPSIVIDVNVGYGWSRADAPHPVYDTRIETDLIGGAVSAFVPIKPFGSSGWSVWGSTEFKNKNANVDFFNSRLSAVMVGLAWRRQRQ
jgi:hypothetical protein